MRPLMTRAFLRLDGAIWTRLSAHPKEAFDFWHGCSSGREKPRMVEILLGFSSWSSASMQGKTLLLVSGIYDLSEIPDGFLKHEAKVTLEEVAGWTPLHSDDHKGPTRVFSDGANETRPFDDQAAAMQAKLSGTGQQAELLVIAKLNYMSVVHELGDPNTLLGRKLAEVTIALRLLHAHSPRLLT